MLSAVYRRSKDKNANAAAVPRHSRELIAIIIMSQSWYSLQLTHIQATARRKERWRCVGVSCLLINCYMCACTVSSIHSSTCVFLCAYVWAAVLSSLCMCVPFAFVNLCLCLCVCVGLWLNNLCLICIFPATLMAHPYPTRRTLPFCVTQLGGLIVYVV